MISTRFVTRVRVVTFFCLLIALVLIGKLYYLQVVHGEEYARRADAQQVELKDPLLNRGIIYLTERQGTLITAATLREVGREASSSNPAAHQRYYPGGSLAAQVLGFVAYNNDNEQKGRYGLERYYEQTLARGGGESYSNFFVELFGGFAGAFSGSGGGQGDIVTTIEPSVEAELERVLAGYVGSWRPALAWGIIMDPKTGEIVAMATMPSFDLNVFNLEQGTEIFKNPHVESVYEMGSIIKPLTLAAGLDSGAITEASTYDDKGCITLDQKKICNFDMTARGVLPMQEILSQSLNMGSADRKST